MYILCVSNIISMQVKEHAKVVKKVFIKVCFGIELTKVH